MLQLNHFGYSNEAECLELVTMFACIEEDDLREKVLNVVKALATKTGELVTPDEITFS
jgi:hypothetical protein